MRALAELVRDPNFTQDDLNEERRVVLDELDRDASDPIRGLYTRVGQRLWSTAWGRKDAGGDPAALATVTPKLLKQIFQQYYVPNNSVVIVSGDVMPERVFQLAGERFSHWKRQADPFAGWTPYAVPGPGLLNCSVHTRAFCAPDFPAIEPAKLIPGSWVWSTIPQ